MTSDHDTKTAGTSPEVEAAVTPEAEVADAQETGVAETPEAEPAEAPPTTERDGTEAGSAQEAVAGAESAQERRIEPRVPVDIWIRQELGRDISYTHSADISTGGIKFDHGFPHPIGTEVELRFSLPGSSHEFKVAAEVVGSGLRQERPITHLRFLKMTVDEYVLLTRFVRNQLRPEAPPADDPGDDDELEE